MYVLDDAVVTATTPAYETLVLASDDGGSSWSVVNKSGTLIQPQQPASAIGP
jgi:hypothetical protein